MNTAKNSDSISLTSAATVLISNRKATRSTSTAAAQNGMADKVPFTPSTEQDIDTFVPSNDPSSTTNRADENPVEDMFIANRDVGGSPNGPDQRQGLDSSANLSDLSNSEDEELDDDLRAEMDAVEAEIKAAKAAKAAIKEKARQRKRKRNMLMYLDEQKKMLRNQNRDNDDDESDSKPAAV